MIPCILPWINFSTNTFGRPRVCGYSDQAVVQDANVKLKGSSIDAEWNNEYFKKIRKDFLSGNWPENCKRCKYVEELNGQSKRKEENKYHYENNKHLMEQTSEDGSVPYYPPNMDIRVGTICNLKCIHCGTGASSKWNQEKKMLNKYPNTMFYDIDNKWIEQDSFIWDNIRENIDQTKRFNFLGGEPFANKQHNKFIEDISKSEYAKDITISYVSNGTLLNKSILEQLVNFKQIIIRLSVDALKEPGEYFRFPLKWVVFEEKLKLIEHYASLYKNLDIGVQWTCSNVSMFYLVDTYDYIKKHFPSIKFLFCNHVEWPIHMSAQVLPIEIKEKIKKNIEEYDWNDQRDGVLFYINHMLERDLWQEHGITFMNYLDDLDKARNIRWKESFNEMNLGKYDPR